MSGEKISPMPEGLLDRLAQTTPLEYGKIHIVHFHEKLIPQLQTVFASDDKFFVGFSEGYDLDNFSAVIRSGIIMPLTSFTPSDIISSAFKSLHEEKKNQPNLWLSMLAIPYTTEQIEEIMRESFKNNIKLFFNQEGMYPGTRQGDIQKKITQVYIYF